MLTALLQTVPQVPEDTVPVATFLVSGAGTGQELSIDITPLVNK